MNRQVENRAEAAEHDASSSLAGALPLDTDWDDEIARLLAEPMPEFDAPRPVEADDAAVPRDAAVAPDVGRAASHTKAAKVLKAPPVENAFPDDPLLATDESFPADAHDALAPLVARDSKDRTGYAPIWNRARKAQFGSLSVGVLAVVNIAALTFLNQRLESFSAANDPDLGSVTIVSQIINWGLQPALVVAVAVSVGLLVRLCRQAYVNLDAFRVRGLRWSRTSVTVALCLPGINVIAAKFILDEMWFAARPYSEHDNGWRRRRPNPWILAWWVLMTTSVVLLTIHGSGTVTGIEASVDANRWIAIALAVLGLASLALVPGLSAIGHRDAVHAETLGLAHAADIPEEDGITTLGLRAGAGRRLGA